MDPSLQPTQGLKRKRSLDAGTATACDQCHRCKVRCSSGRPSCERCERNESICTYSLGKPLGKPPKSTRQKIWRPTPSSPRSAVAPQTAQDQNFDRIGYVHLRRQEDIDQSESGPFPGLGDTGNRDMNLAHSIHHELAYNRPVSAPYDDRIDLEQAQSDVFPASSGQAFFSPAETDIDLGFLDDTNFGRDSIMHAGMPSSSVPNTAVVVAGGQNANKKSHFSRPHAAVTPGPSSYPTPTSLSRLPADPSNESLREALTMPRTSPSAPLSSPNEANKLSPSQRPSLLETISHLCSKTPSATESLAISEVLQLARQGLQAVHQCLPAIQSRAPEGSSLAPARSASHETGILAGILLTQQVLAYYDSLSHQHSPSPATAMVSPPSSSTETHPPFSRPSFSFHRAHTEEPIRIGNFEVDCFVSRQLILDAVVAAEKQKARHAVSKLEKWARELVEQGRQEGLLAAAFLKPLKRRLSDASL